MHSRLYRLIEKHQRIDVLLRLAEQRRAADRSEIEQLRGLKSKVKQLILRCTLRTAHS